MNKKLSLLLSALSVSAGLLAQDSIISKEQFQTNVIHSFKQPRQFVWLDAQRKLPVDEIFKLPVPVYKALSVAGDSVFFYCFRNKDLDVVAANIMSVDWQPYTTSLPIADSTYFIAYFRSGQKFPPPPMIEDTFYNNVITSFHLPKPQLTLEYIKSDEKHFVPPPPPPVPPHKKKKPR